MSAESRDCELSSFLERSWRGVERYSSCSGRTFRAIAGSRRSALSNDRELIQENKMLSFPPFNLNINEINYIYAVVSKKG